jgi:hypothetical protein
MSWLWFVLAVLIIAPLVGFAGLALMSTPAGQYFIAAVVCAIATYWMTLANNDHRMS